MPTHVDFTSLNLSHTAAIPEMSLQLQLRAHCLALALGPHLFSRYRHGRWMQS